MAERKIPVGLPLYDTMYASDFPTQQYYVVLFDTIPSVHSSHEMFSVDIIKYFEEKLGFLEESRVKSVRERGRSHSERSMLVNTEKRMIMTTRLEREKGDGLCSFDVHYDVGFGPIEEQLNFVEINKSKKPAKKSNIQIVKSEMGHLDIEEYDLDIPECDLSLNYGNEFVKLHETIVKRLNTPRDKGIILFHGDPGTGKTTYIKLLTSLIKKKEILFIPPSMAEMLSDPSIVPFLMEHKDSILLIEDAEKVVGSRDGEGSQVAVSNLLNLTDGILGDCLNVQVIATFNMPRENIDAALLRKGRLICEHKFKELEVDETNKLLKHLKKDITSEKGLTLADIYNVDVETNRITNERRPAGFQQFRGHPQ